jgi:hypothetical protein
MMVVRKDDWVATPLSQGSLSVGNAMGPGNDDSCVELMESGTETVEQKRKNAHKTDRMSMPEWGSTDAVPVASPSGC